MRILFITSNRLGDAVLSTGLIGHLLDTTDDPRLTIACGPLPAALFRATPAVERVIPLVKRRFALHWAALWRACAGTRWDLVVDLRNSIVSRIVPARRRVIYTRPIGGLHKVEELARVLGASPPPPPRLWLDPAAVAAARALLPDDHRPVLALAPTANWVGKEWPSARFAQLARRLTSDGGRLAGARVAVFGAEAERARARPLLEELGPLAIDLVGRTGPLEAAACLGRAALFVGNDSGLMHIAAAMGVPTIGVFGPGQPLVYGPWGPATRAVVTTEPAAAIAAREHDVPTPTDLLSGVSIEAVLAATHAILDQGGG